MQIDGVNAGNGLALGLTKVRTKNQDDQGVPEPTASNITGADTPVVQTTDSTTETTEEIPGVIRNLMDGQFKGVADVRLRINFNEEIEAIEAAQRQAIADELLAQILGSITGTVDDEPPLESATALVAESQDQSDEADVTDLDGVAELQEALADDFNAITESYAGTSTSSDELAEDLWAAFYNYVDSMLELYPPPAEDPAEESEPVPPAEPETETETETEPAPAPAPAPASEPEPESVLPSETDPEPIPIPPPDLSTEPVPTPVDDESLIAALEPVAETETTPVEEPAPIGETTPLAQPVPVAEPEPETETTPVEEPVAETETTPVAEPAPETETEPEPTPDIQDYLLELEATFSTAIDELIEALSTVSVLPDLSEPSGDGSAYEKFVAIYDELQNDGGAETVDAVG